MSEHCSFVTEYIFCEKCFAACKKHLLKKARDSDIDSIIIPSTGIKGHKGKYPIIAGFIHGLAIGEELIDMRSKILPELELDICHKIRIAVIPEATGHQKILIAKPNIRGKKFLEGQD